MKFRYQATDSRGELQRGNITADSEAAARQQIEHKGWSLVSLNSDAPPKQAPKLEETPAVKPTATTLDSRQTAALAIAGFLLLGLLIMGINRRYPEPAPSESTVTTVATKKIVFQGVLPTDGLDGIHVSCLKAAVQIDPDPKKLARPGQSFSSLIEVPLDSGDIVLEVSHSGRRWVVARLRPQDPQQLYLPVIEAANPIALNPRSYQSHFAPPRTNVPSLDELRRSNDERLLRENDFARQHGLPIRNKIR